MGHENSAKQMIDLLTYPAFTVENGKISYCNESASSLFLLPGTDIFSILNTGKEEYTEFKEGHLYLTVFIGNSPREATVVAMEDQHLFLLSDGNVTSQLQAVSLAAQQLRMPLSDIVATTNMLLPNIDTKENATTQQHLAQFQRSLHQLLRLVGNMSDAAKYAQEPSANMVTIEATSLFAEVAEKAAVLLAQAEITLLYDGPTVPVYLLADAERIERSIYNLISNAVKFSPKGSVLRATLARRKDLLLFTLSDPGERLAQQVQSNVFNRFMRQPGLGDSRFGLGLGLNIVHNTATAHGGTVLLESPPSGGVKITMTLRIRQNEKAIVRSPYFLDYAGGHDHGLIELSDVLPASAYKKEL
jgi:signal transduction histidine kinase